jgi:5-methylcytosine-specific restriction endonuclease McrA
MNGLDGDIIMFTSTKYIWQRWALVDHRGDLLAIEASRDHLHWQDGDQIVRVRISAVTSAQRRLSRLGSRARARITAGGPLAKGRPAETAAGWERVKAAVHARAKGLCEYHGKHAGQDCHHVVKRSQGGADHEDNIVLLCRRAHDLTDAPYAKGRLVIEALGHGQFRYAITTSRLA